MLDSGYWLIRARHPVLPKSKIEHPTSAFQHPPFCVNLPSAIYERSILTGRVTEAGPGSVERRSSRRGHGDRQRNLHRSQRHGQERRRPGHGLCGLGGRRADVIIRSTDVCRAVRGYARRGR